MMIAAPYLPEWEVYRQTPPEHRWIYNKLELAERLGQQCWPVGLKFPAGDYCVRPIMNLSGAAFGGFKRVILRKPDFIQRPAGYCVTPWADDFRHWYSFVEDACWYSQETYKIEGDIEHMRETDDKISLPDCLCGISMYLLVETLGDMIIDVGPRHDLTEVRAEIVEYHQQRHDADYEVPSYCTYGFGDKYRRYWDEDLQGWRHEEIEHD